MKHNWFYCFFEIPVFCPWTIFLSMDFFLVHGLLFLSIDKKVFEVLGDPARPLQEKNEVLIPRFSALSGKIWSAQTWLQWLQHQSIGTNSIGPIKAQGPRAQGSRSPHRIQARIPTYFIAGSNMSHAHEFI